ncbi:MAG: biotin synthase [Lentisphaerae bacterium ADurb.Bin082]|nr:MAG: biotin synthase [Lentisphaerae bacterium ADurb.Bin082]
MKKVDINLIRILDRVQEGHALSKADAIALLNFAPTSVEAGVMRGVADALARQRFGNEAIIFGQVGVEIAACPAKCKFCSFGEGHTQFKPSKMTPEEIMDAADRFTSSGDLYAFLLMTMHTFDFDALLDIVQRVRTRVPKRQQIVVNIGDIDRAQTEALRQVGVNGAYHVCRLREGTDTTLAPEDRKRTIRAIKEAGLDWYNCCEPIGPEHTAQELVDQIFLGMEYGCFQHAAMRRVWMPSSPLANYGQITELRLAQVTAVVALASLGCPDTMSVGVHEPNLIGLTSGANVVYAETGANPRDTEEETSTHRGRDIRACKTMLYEAGFEHLLVAPKERRPLGNAYRE